MAFKSIRNLIACSGAAVALAAAEPSLDETRSTLEKWVETRQLISRTKTDWQMDKELLEQQVALFERELKSVSEAAGKVDTSSAQVGKERAEAEAAIKSAEAALSAAKVFTTDFQAQIQKITPRLPSPLHETLKPLLNRLPADAATTKMAPTERAQVIVGILNEIDKFNNSIGIYNEKRKNDRGEEIAVQTVYVGVGAAYFVNDAGDFAGVGTPSASGWDWSAEPEISGAVQDVVRIYRNEGGARFVALPVSIK